jgi:broad specificity phosphatase PhoE
MRTLDDITGWLMRHPECEANVGGMNQDDLTPLTPLGLQQTESIFTFIKKNDVQHVVCTHADRTFAAMMEQWDSSIALSKMPFFGEWKRADAVKKLNRADPEAKRIKLRRLEEFGPDFQPLKGEESWENILLYLYRGFQYLRDLECQRVLVLTHRHRAMQALAYVLAGGVELRFNVLEYDVSVFPREFVSFFKAFDKIARFENTDYFELKYQKRFDSDERCWNWNLGRKLLPL